MPTPKKPDDFYRGRVEHRQGYETTKAAAAALGLSRNTYDSQLKEAARRGIAPGHFDSGTAPGFHMGKVTIQRGSAGQVERTWERQAPGDEAMQEALQAAVEVILEDSKGCLPPVPSPTSHDKDLLTVIPMGDPHFGLLAWAAEVGENFDLKIAERLTIQAVDRLATSGPSTATAMLLNLGDYFHADNATNRTPRSGATLDVDGRFDKIAAVGIAAMVRCVRRLLEKHERVIVRNNRGNHDPHQASMLTLALQGWFHNEPRVQIETTPSSFYYYRFGKTLIGSTHGDGAKMADLPLIMATDEPEMWAASKYRVWHCGHVHHDQTKEHPGCTVETHRTLAAGDAWHRHSGYRSGRDMKAIIYHREHGEVTRIRCGIGMLEA
tara:strand:+ start:9643 stop:10782 length:1140 start_codon:yes stop_codon:yes gene_type:complete